MQGGTEPVWLGFLGNSGAFVEKELKHLTVPAKRNRHRVSRNLNLSKIATAPLQKLVDTSSLLFEGHHLSERIPRALALGNLTVIPWWGQCLLWAPSTGA